MKKLSKAQQEAIKKMKPGRWHSSYGIGCSIATMEALCRKGVVRAHSRNNGLGSIYSPQTSNLWQLV